MNPVARSQWRNVSRWPALGERETHVWRADLNRLRLWRSALELTLSHSERKQARQYKSALDRDRYILTSALVRNILSRYLGANPRELKFTSNRYGKPQLSNGELRFNVSHSFGMTVCAVSRCFEVGIDVERIRTGVEEQIAGWFLSLRALKFLEKLPQPRRRQTFFQGWTRVEAYGKALGVGFAENVYTLEALFEAANTCLGGSHTVRPGNRFCRLQDFKPREGYAAAVATSGGEGTIVYCNWPARKEAS